MRDEGGDVLGGATAGARLVNGGTGRYRGCDDIRHHLNPARARGVPAGRPRPTRPTRRGLTVDECATVLATCLRPRRTGLHWADVDLSDGNNVVVTVRRSKANPTGGRERDGRRLVGGCAAAVRSLIARHVEVESHRTPPVLRD